MGKKTVDEAKQQKSVTFETYRNYIMNYHGGWKFLILANLAVMVYQQLKVYNDYLIGVWS